MNHQQLADKNRRYTFASWAAQSAWKPLSTTRAEGVYFWDADGKRFLDWSSMLMNVNIGHGNSHVIRAIQEQAQRLTYCRPNFATEPRARLGEILAQITPGNLSKSFFTLGGADAIENAMKVARLYTGRQKVITRYRSYHGGTFAAASAGGDPRRIANEPGVPWIVRVHDPYPYRSPLYRGRTTEEGDRALVDQIRETVEYEGPGTVAALLLEGYSGSSGIMQGGEVFWRGIQEICDDYGVVLIVDEVMSGFGRTGEWFGIEHYPYVTPDILVMAKGLTSGYAPLGAVSVSDEIASHFEDDVLWCGLTYSAHALSCAAAIANYEVYRDERLIERANAMERIMRAGLEGLRERHPSVGDIRGAGLHFVLELVKDRETREPMSPFNRPLTEPMAAVAHSLIESGLSTFVRWNMIFCNPPLIITEEQIQEGIDALDRALNLADAGVERA